MKTRIKFDVGYRPVKITAVLLIIMSLHALFGCAKQGTSQLEQGLSLYRQNKLQEACPLLQKAVEQEYRNPDANAWLAETYRRLGQKKEAIRRNDWVLEKKAARRMYETEFFTPALLTYNRWMLRHWPKNAILLTNGDMDTYPAVSLQEVEGFRTDVIVVNRSLLNTTWYARYLRDQLGLPLPVQDAELDTLKPYQDENRNLVFVSDQIVRVWLKQREEGAFPRPITISVTVGDRSFAANSEDHLGLFGPFYSWFPVSAESPQDTAILRACLDSIDPNDFSGPLVSAQDRSPVRIISSNRLVENVTAAALRYSQVLIESERPEEALEMLEWAEKFESKTESGPAFAEKIEELKEIARQKMG